MEDFGVKGISGGGLRWLTLKGGEPIIGSESRVRLTSTPQIETEGIDNRLISGESILEDREEVRRRKEWFCQEDNGVKGTPLEMGYLLTLASLLQVYFVLPSWTSQGIYLCWTAFVQRLISTGLSSLLKYQFLPPNRPERLR